MTGQIGPALGLTLTGGLANGAARLMTNPRFVRWLARTTELPVGALPAQINVLKRIGAENSDDEITQAAETLAQDSPQRVNGEGG